jgi:RHS repeat-associated protein
VLIPRRSSDDARTMPDRGERMISSKMARFAAGIARAMRRLLAPLAAGALAAPALAQELPQVISPLQVESDQNGVNLITGGIQIPLPTLSVPGAPNLRFDRVLNAAPYVNGSRWGGEGDYSGGSFSVHTGRSTSDTFQCEIDDQCTSIMGSGSTFSPWGLTYQEEGTGAFWTFDLKQHETQTSGALLLQYYASSVVYPDGEVLSYGYATTPQSGGVTYYRPTTISSNRGYHITISYHSDTMWTQGWHAPYQAAIYRTSEPSTPLARLTYSLDGQTITDLGGRVYTCTGCTNQFAGGVEAESGSLQLPGESTPSFQMTGGTATTVVRDGVTWTYTFTNRRWDAWHQALIWDALTVTGPNGYNQVYEYTTVNGWSGGQNVRRVISRVTDSLGRQTSYNYDSSFRPTRATYPEANRVDVVYGPGGMVASRTATAKPGSGEAAIAETAHFQCTTYSVACYRPVWSRDGLNRQTDYVHNAAGQQTQQDDPADANGVRRRTMHEYTLTSGLSRRTVTRVCGATTTCGTNQEIRTQYTYWNNTNLPATVTQVDPATSAQLVTTYTYDTAGRVLSEDGPLPGTADARYFRYDVHGRRTWEIDAVGANGHRTARRIEYRNSDDKPTVTEEGTIPTHDSTALTVTRRTEITYDARRNAAVQRVIAGSTTHSLVQRTFDNRNRLECEARRMNPAIYGSLPASACTLGTQGSHGPDRITRNLYDNAGQLLQIQRAYGTSLQQNYATYQYSLNGQRTRVTDANGNRADLRYDGHDRQIRWVFPHLTSTGSVNESDYEAQTYDAVGNRLTLRKRDGVTITYAYDNLNRMTVKTVPTSASGAAGYSVHYGYDLRNAQTFARFGSTIGYGLTNAYDAFGRLTSTINSTGGTSRTLSYQYDAGSRRTRLTFPDANYFTYEQAANGQLTMVRENGGTPVATFGYDSAGRPSAQDHAGAAAAFGYDGVSRLASLGIDLAGSNRDVNWAFAYNPASQILTRTRDNDAYASNTAYDVSRSYSVNGLNQYTAAGTASFLYDGNGNLRADGSTNYVYDAENRLVSASGGSSATLSYDPMGRLFQVTGGGNTTQLLYDGDELVAEYNGSGTLLRRYAHGLGNDDPVIWYEGVGLTNRLGLFADHQGSIVAVADSSGTSIAANAYDPWGIPNATNQGRFGYSGQIWLPEIGMWHYKARIYSPTLGRFLQTDPVGYQGGNNLYAYVGNDPVNRTDSTGLTADDELAKTRQTLQAFRRELRNEIRAASQPAPGSRVPSRSDVGRVQALRTALGQLDGVRPEGVAGTRVDAPDASVGAGLADSIQRPETVYTARGSNSSPIYERGDQISRTSDSGQANVRTSNLLAIGHEHEPGEGRQYPGIGDPVAVLVSRVPSIYVLDGNVNSIGWNGSRFTLTNIRGSLPSYGSSPQWMRSVFEPW